MKMLRVLPLFVLAMLFLFAGFADAQVAVRRPGVPAVSSFRAGFNGFGVVNPLAFRAGLAARAFVSPFGFGGAAFVAPQAFVAQQAFVAPYVRQRLIVAQPIVQQVVAPVQQYVAPQQVIVPQVMQSQVTAPLVQQVVTPDTGCAVVPQALRLRVRAGY